MLQINKSDTFRNGRRVFCSEVLEGGREGKVLILHFPLPSIIAPPPSQLCSWKSACFLWVFPEEWKDERTAWLSVYVTRWGSPELFSKFIAWRF